MKTWKKHLKDYKIIEWNESNFDISSHPFVKKAYEAKKWAYVSDYIRMYAIYNYGGIYLDTDVLVLENFDKFLNNKVFVGFERENYPCGICPKWIKRAHWRLNGARRHGILIAEMTTQENSA